MNKNAAGAGRGGGPALLRGVLAEGTKHMQIKRLKNPAAAAPLAADWPETMLWSCLEGCMGGVWANDETTPTAALFQIGDFGFLAGRPCAELAGYKPVGGPPFIILVPQNEGWAAEIERALGPRAVRRTRYAFRKGGEAFDRQALTGYTRLQPPFELKPVNQVLYRQILTLSWAKDLCSQFADWEAYRAHGLGWVALRGDEVVAGASSYTYYSGGIEIEIDTRKDQRRRGLATACGAQLILDCLDRGLYPSWDAQNPVSAALAQKLGYCPAGSYPVYELCW